MSTNIGFFGKVPAHGDFIERGLAQIFSGPMDEWLQGAIACSQGALGSEWLSTYLTCPIWRFGLSEGTINDKKWLGILCPSVDAVGRYFPLVFAAEITHGNIFAVYQRNADWFDDLERLAIQTLEQGLNADQIEACLSNLNPIKQDVSRPIPMERHGWLIHGNSAEAFGLMLNESNAQSSISLWETKGGETQLPLTFIAKTMPPAHYYTHFLTGNWQ